jgi:hypothetical protein
VAENIHPMNYIAGVSETSPESLMTMVHQWKSYDEGGRVAVLKLLSWNTLPEDQEAVSSLIEIGRYIDQTRDATELEKAHVILGFESHGSHWYHQMRWYGEGGSDGFIGSTKRSVDLQRRLDELLSQPEAHGQHQPPREVLDEYQDDLKWYLTNEEPLFEGPSFHRLQAAAMCMVLENRTLPSAFLEALDDFSSTGFAAGFILAQLHLCSGNKERARELLQSLLEFHGDALPDSDDTSAFLKQFHDEIFGDIVNHRALVPSTCHGGKQGVQNIGIQCFL